MNIHNFYVAAPKLYLHSDALYSMYIIASLGSKLKYNWSNRGDARTLWKGVRRYSTFLSGIMDVLALFGFCYAPVVKITLRKKPTIDISAIAAIAAIDVNAILKNLMAFFRRI